MTLAELQARRTAYMEAELAILKNQEYRIRDGGIDRWLRRADLETVRATIAEIDQQIAAQDTTTRRVIYLR